MSDYVIKAENLGKKYRIGLQQPERYVALRDVLTRKAADVGYSILGTGRHLVGLNGRGNGKHVTPNNERLIPKSEEFWALKDVSFEVKQGEVVGIIGRNGAGKSTLLKILSRITEPTTGRVRISGRVASLLEVGTGFHPELTGRENIFLNGAILGMSRDEIKRKFDQIVDFSGVEKFLDTPVKRYSSGMCVRLAFAVAAHLEPEILIIDEVLAVVDTEFQKKCLGKMEDVASEGRTVLFVSHNMAAVQKLCERVAVLDSGRIMHIDTPADAVRLYFRLTTAESENDAPVATQGRGFQLCGVRVEHEDGGSPHTRAAACFHIPVQFERPCKDPHVHLFVQAPDGETIFGFGSEELSGQRYHHAGTNFCFKFRVASLPLLSGSHRLCVKVRSWDLGINERIDLGNCFEVAETPVYGITSVTRQWHGLAAVDASVEIHSFPRQRADLVTE